MHQTSHHSAGKSFMPYATQWYQALRLAQAAPLSSACVCVLVRVWPKLWTSDVYNIRAPGADRSLLPLTETNQSHTGGPATFSPCVASGARRAGGTHQACQHQIPLAQLVWGLPRQCKVQEKSHEHCHGHMDTTSSTALWRHCRVTLRSITSYAPGCCAGSWSCCFSAADDPSAAGATSAAGGTSAAVPLGAAVASSPHSTSTPSIGWKSQVPEGSCSNCATNIQTSEPEYDML